MNKIIAAILVLTFAATAHAQPRTDYTAGYQSRACGFDMDDDGDIGEADDDCNVCDGVTTDPDGDGDPEDLIYVDCNSGSNSNPGTAASPKLTIAGALAIADGSGDGREDIICVRATCASYNSSGVNNQSIGVSGVSGTRTKTATGNEAFDYQYPSDPVMIVGWDTDNDGEYPPYDSSQPEPAIIDGCNVSGGCGAGNGSGSTAPSYNQAFSLSGTDRVEVAHLTVKNYGWQCQTNEGCGFWTMSGEVDHVYVHDNALVGIGSGSVTGGNTSGFGIFRGFVTTGSSYLAFENNNVTEHGMYPLRTSGGGDNNAGSSYLRYSGNTIGPWDVSSTGQAPARFWNWRDVEIVDNKWDKSGITAGSAAIGGGELSMTNSNIQRVHIIGNEWIDYPIAIRRSYVGISTATASPSEGDPSSGLYIRRNKFTYTRNIQDETYTIQLIPNSAEVSCVGGADGQAGMHQVYVEGNLWDYTDYGSNSNLRSAFEYQNGNDCGSSSDTFGPLYFQNNTIIGFNPSTAWTPGTWTETNIRAALIIGMTNKDSQTFDNTGGDVFIRNNIFSGFDNDYVLINRKPIGTHYNPGTDLFMDGNAYSGSSLRFYSSGGTVGGSTTTASAALSAWKAATGEDDNSKACSPSFDTDGYTLLQTDSCAQNSGTTVCAGTCSGNADCLASNPATDIEGETRPVGTCDIGADEYTSGIVDPCSVGAECNTAADCSDGNVCTTDTCLGCPRVCGHTNNTNSCSDGLYCTGADTCSGGSCSVHAGTPCPGADGDSDCSEVCNEATDSCTANDPNGSACSDGAYCTSGETCSSGTCTGGTDPCTHNPALDDCTQACNETTDDCTATSDDGLACDDGLFCTEPDACDTGDCTGAALDCSASSTSCKTGTCDEGTDACVSGANKADGTECDDGTFCNGTDECSSGDCSVHAGDPCLGGPNPICTESTDSCSAYTESGGMICYGCSCQGCYIK